MRIPWFARRKEAVVGLTVGVPMSLVFLWLAGRNADLASVQAALASANVGLALVGMAGLGSAIVLAAVRWSAVARTPQVPRTRFVEMSLSGLAVNDVLPGRLGELLRARWLAVAAAVPGGRAFASVIVDRAFDVAALVIFLMLSLPFVTSAAWLTRIAVGGIVLLGAVVLVLAGARVYTRRAARSDSPHGNTVRRLARDTLEGLAEPLGRRRALSLLILSLGIWTTWAVSAWVVARSMGIELRPVQTLFVAAVVNLGVAIPSSPGFIGTYQWLAVSALALFGVGTSEALAFAILLHALWYVPTLLVGGGLLARRGVLAMRLIPARRVMASYPAAGEVSDV